MSEKNTSGSAVPEVYLFTGPENGDKSEALDNIRSIAEKKNGAVDFYRYYASETRIADIVAQLQNESLFSSALFVVVKNAELIKNKSDISLLTSYIKSAGSSSNTLVLESDENSVEKSLESAVAKDHRKIFWEMFDNQKPVWLRNFFQKNGFKITDDAVEQILDMIENNTEALKSECSRFFYCFENGHTVTLDDVDKILSHNREENAFTLFEAMADCSRSPKERLETSLAVLQKIRLSRDSGSFGLFSGLAYCFRQLRDYLLLCEGGVSPSELQLKSADFTSKKKKTLYANASRVWGPGAVASILSLIAYWDMAGRESGTMLENTRLVLLVYSIVIKNGVYIAQYQAD